ncbi:uncharacterized protein I303_103250 [Kwoniella dejecticola CBS 10117]|uniref:Type I phosphodiesterase/nucleotide pyrophosphatase n=1 Tax=Kwoniella dejecticola CBS 10117 TaxID=1296121 RepID=A0A1A6AB25_9TREE|nr:type I phosphodiesterase/nucleotide pyrophosphatase [Kwoniella dejecticola CBS 10117]OBR87248.1 type I phosphodiesterase/nucleotide pyrophosphatase [Kwoniella dejecticola CBS 10117]
MPNSPSYKTKGKIKRSSESSQDVGEDLMSGSEDDLTARPATKGSFPNGDEGHVEDFEEQDGLLAGDNASFKPMMLDEGRRRKGWIRILGVPLPKPLLYLLAIPLILLILSSLPDLSFVIPFTPKHLSTLSNGTHDFYPTVLLISLDGFRPEYLSSHKDLLPNLLSISTRSNGIRAESMQPVFPSLTFPNHWSLMTGLHPESHGIVANNFYDPLFTSHTNAKEGTHEKEASEPGAQFVYIKEDKSWDANWWWGEPIWGVVERMKRRSAVIMWPGPPITKAGISPSFFVPYRKLAPSEKVKTIFSYLDHPISERPEFIASYFPEIDQAGHKGGPNSKGVNDTLKLCDDMLGELFEAIQERNLGNVIDVIIVSDHGMAETSNDRMIYLDDILGEDGVNAIEHEDGWPSVGLRFKAGTDTEYYLNILLEAAEQSNGTFAVYTHDTMPDRWHFSHGHRIAPIYVVPTIGWAITNHHEHEVLFQGDYQPKGNHGYDNLFPEMQAIFFSQGPFVNLLKEKAIQAVYESHDPPILKNFKNLEIFSLVTRLLGLSAIEPAHNGTIGFWDNYLGSA